MNFGDRYSFYQKTFEDFLNQKILTQDLFLTEYASNQLDGFGFLKQQIKFEVHSSNYSKKLKSFYESIKYSIGGDGKRFRPILSLAVADLFGEENFQKVLPLSLAMEMIHTYSLIHDDLPCMDNDDERRGKPTNHKVYGESTALLAGDALLTEAFRVLSEASCNPQSTLRVIQLVTECAGTLGMIGGQYVDLTSQKNKVNLEELIQMQINKTGALIRASIVGSAILCEASEKEISALENFSKYIGLNFQIADDILDYQKKELGSFVGILGLEKSREILEKLTEESLLTLKDFKKPQFLIELAQFNSKRLK